MACERHLRVIFVVGTCMCIAWKIKVTVSFFSYFQLICTAMWHQHVDYIIRSHGKSKSCWTSKECNGAIDDVVGTT